MVTRREVLGAGLASTGVAGGTVDQGTGADSRKLDEIVDRLGRLAQELKAANGGCFTGTCDAASKIREAMIQFLRAQGKFPDMIEVGPETFLDMMDWHVRNRAEASASRGPDGRYGLTFQFTRLILRPDAQPGFIGLPYDARA